MLRTFVVALLGSIAISQDDSSCSVLSSGAKCDGLSDDTSAIQKAINACTYAIVELPAGRTCLSFPLAFHNGTSLHIPSGATLKAFPDVARWPNSTQFNFVELKRQRDIAVFGEGTIDGSGQQWWVIEMTNRPRLFHMQYVNNISFQGVTLKNTGAMTLVFNSPCSDALIDGITIENPAVGNTDGIDMGCDGALIQNTRVVNGDDSICMKSGARNVLVRNCTVENGKQYPESKVQGLAGGLVLGSSDNNNMSNVTFTNCTVIGALAGIRVKFRATQTGNVKCITFDNIRIFRPVMYAVDVLMDSNHFFGSSAGTVDVGDITIRKVYGELGRVPKGVCGEGKICPRAVARFHCTQDLPCAGMKLEHFHISGFNSSETYPVPCEWTNAYGTGFDVEPSQCAPSSAIGSEQAIV